MLFPLDKQGDCCLFVFKLRYIQDSAYIMQLSPKTCITLGKSQEYIKYVLPNSNFICMVGALLNRYMYSCQYLLGINERNRMVMFLIHLTYVWEVLKEKKACLCFRLLNGIDLLSQGNAVNLGS
jgi:hypothetical protein